MTLQLPRSHADRCAAHAQQSSRPPPARPCVPPAGHRHAGHHCAAAAVARAVAGEGRSVRAAAVAEEQAAASGAAQEAGAEGPSTSSSNNSSSSGEEKDSRAGSGKEAVPTAEEWELDFGSRPVLDERGKKRWELLICDADRRWEYSRWFPNNQVNSTQLRAAVEEVLATPGAVRPQRARFFRAQMQNIISKALEGAGVQPLPSRRCYSLIGWLAERTESVYPADPGFSPGAAGGSSLMLDLGAPEPLPDNLRGESWGFVQLPLGVLRGELRDVEAGTIFGSGFPPERAGLGDLPDDTLVPGVAVYSRRAEPIAAWLGNYEVARVVADTQRAYLVLETAVTQRWRYASYRRGRENDEEARAWEAAKVRTRGLHFLVLQSDAEAEQCAGLWLLLDQPLPSV